MQKIFLSGLKVTILLIGILNISLVFADAGNLIYGNISVLPEKSRENKIYFHVNNSKKELAYGFFNSSGDSNVTLSVDENSFLTYNNKKKGISFKVVQRQQIQQIVNYYVDGDINNTAHLIYCLDENNKYTYILINKDRIVFRGEQGPVDYLEQGREYVSGSKALYNNVLYLKDGTKKLRLIRIKLALLSNSEYSYDVTCSKDGTIRLKQGKYTVFEGKESIIVRILNGYDDSMRFEKTGEFISKTIVKIGKNRVKLGLYSDTDTYNNPLEHQISVSGCASGGSSAIVSIVSKNMTYTYPLDIR